MCSIHTRALAAHAFVLTRHCRHNQYSVHTHMGFSASYWSGDVVQHHVGVKFHHAALPSSTSAMLDLI